jgi:predicted esterase
VDSIDDAQRTFKIVDEILACYCGDASKVHLAGVSNAGLAAFALMLRRPERFATLLSAPGAFPVNTDPADWAKALAGHSIFNGVGAHDDGWKSQVKATHEALVAAGIDSVYVEFADQRHTVNEAFDKNVFFNFWTKH